jgi:hypothetical protein
MPSISSSAMRPASDAAKSRNRPRPGFHS